MGSLRSKHGSWGSPRAAPFSQGTFFLTTSMFTLTDAIRQVEQAIARGEQLSDVVQWVSRDYAIDASLLTRRWVQFTPASEPRRRPVAGGVPLTAGDAGPAGRPAAK